MRSRLVGLIEKAELALGSCRDVISQVELDGFAAIVANVRARLAYPDQVLVVALAGGTGSGKSSLFNAIAGDELVDVGGVRPTTTDAAALIPIDMAGAFDGYLERLGITERYTASLTDICVIDLPDYDSVEHAHRLRVDALLPVVDLVVWVLDPEKYHDARLHHEYIRPNASHSEQFIFVLNQVDRISREQLDDVLEDLVRALEGSGVDQPEVVPVAVDPRAPGPIGIELLIAAIDRKRSRPIYGKLLDDLTTAADRLSESLGSPTDFDRRSRQELTAAGKILDKGETRGASDQLTEFLDEVAGEVGGLAGERLARLAGQVPAHVKRISEEGGDRVRMLSEAVMRPARVILAPRALAIASVAEFAIGVRDMAPSGQ